MVERRVVVEGLHLSSVEAVREVVWKGEEERRDGAVLVCGVDAREVVKVGVEGRKGVRWVSCLEVTKGVEELDRLWGESEGRSVVVVEDLNVLGGEREGEGEAREEGDKEWVRGLCAKLDRTLREGGVVVGVCQEVDRVDGRLRRAGRFDQLVLTADPPTPASRMATFEALGAVNPVELTKLSPGYLVRDYLHLLREEGWSILKQSKLERLPAPGRLRGSKVAALPTRSWDSIGGYEVQKKSVRNLCEWPLLYPQTMSALGVDPPSGLLLYGPSGCGKSLLAAGLAAELKYANFLSVKGTSLFSRYLGETEAALRRLFNRARSMLPCVLFIDEIDALCPRRKLLS